MREDGDAAPLYLFEDFRIGCVDEAADSCEGGATPVGEFFDLRIDECGGGFCWDRILHWLLLFRLRTALRCGLSAVLLLLLDSSQGRWFRAKTEAGWRLP